MVAWLALLVLTGGSFLATHLGLGRAGLAVALVIAAIKATIVMLVFMHLSREHFAPRFVAVINVLWVALICLGVLGDVAVR